MVDQIIRKIIYENINTYEFSGHSYFNLIKMCAFQCLIHYHYRQREKIKVQKIQTAKFRIQNYTTHQ